MRSGILCIQISHWVFMMGHAWEGPMGGGILMRLKQEPYQAHRTKVIKRLCYALPGWTTVPITCVLPHDFFTRHISMSGGSWYIYP